MKEGDRACANCGLRSERYTCMWFYTAPPVVQALIQITSKDFQHEPEVSPAHRCSEWEPIG